MPTYLNETSRTLWIKNSSGSKVPVSSGESLETIYFCDNVTIGLTETSAEPYYEEILQEDILTGLSGTSQSVSIHENAENVLVHMITDAVTVRRNHDLANPIFRDQTSTDINFFIDVDGIPGRTKELKITGTGSCRVLQFSE